MTAGDVQRLQRGGHAERHQQREPGLAAPVRPVVAGNPGQQGEHRDTEEGVGSVPVAAADPAEDPGDRLGHEAERPGRRRPALVQVGQQRHACGEAGQRPGLRDRQVHEDPCGQAGRPAGQRVRVPQHQPAGRCRARARPIPTAPPRADSNEAGRTPRGGAQGRPAHVAPAAGPGSRPAGPAFIAATKTTTARSPARRADIDHGQEHVSREWCAFPGCFARFGARFAGNVARGASVTGG